ncbi:protein lin-52 homolog [Anopheles ziemanni]|nr:protein lin-52 homolog [Anopheles ziemanni]
MELEAMEQEDSPQMWHANDPDLAQQPWMKGFTQEDINAMYQLGALSKNGLIVEIKKIFDQAYSIGLQEAKELSKGKSLDIFANTSRRK